MVRVREGPSEEVKFILRLEQCERLWKKLFLVEGAASAKVLRLEQVGLFQEQKEAWCS